MYMCVSAWPLAEGGPDAKLQTLERELDTLTFSMS